MKLSALNVDFSSPSPNPLQYFQGGLRKRASKRGTLLSGYLSVVGLSSVKIVADIHRHADYDNKH